MTERRRRRQRLAGAASVAGLLVAWSCGDGGQSPQSGSARKRQERRVDKPTRASPRRASPPSSRIPTRLRARPALSRVEVVMTDRAPAVQWLRPGDWLTLDGGHRLRYEGGSRVSVRRDADGIYVGDRLVSLQLRADSLGRGLALLDKHKGSIEWAVLADWVIWPRALTVALTALRAPAMGLAVNSRLVTSPTFALPQALKAKLAALALTDDDDGPAVLTRVGRLPGLRHLFLRSATVTDASLEALRRLPGLRSLELVAAQLSDTGLARLAALQKLERLSLVRVPIRGHGLGALVLLPHLAWLDLSGTKLEGESIRALGRLVSLRYLNLSGTKVIAIGLRHLRKLERLQHLDLSKSWVSGAKKGLRHLPPLPQLGSLALRRLVLRAAELRGLHGQIALTELDLSGTRVSSLLTLLPIKTLRRVRVVRTPSLPPAAVAQFRKLRPGIVVVDK